MQPSQFKQNVAQIYLSLVPFLIILFAYATGHISYKIYLPIWIVNMCLMAMAAWVLGAYQIRSQDVEKRQLAVAAVILFIPEMLISIFFGMGPPPGTVKEWVATATEQQVRFCFLIVSGVLIAFGLSALREKLKTTDGNFYSRIGFSAIMIAIPLFIIVMSFWHSFALEAFRIKIASAADTMPEWSKPLNKQIDFITIVEVVLTYFATLAFAASFKAAGWFRKIPANIYMIVSLIAILLIVLSPLYPASVASANFPYIPLMIPAVAFLMPYFMAINLLRRTALEKIV